MLEIGSEKLNTIKKIIKIKDITENQLFDTYNKVILDENYNDDFYFELKKLINKDKLAVNTLYNLLNKIIKVKKVINNLYSDNIIDKDDYDKLLNFLFLIKKGKISINTILDKEFFIDVNNNDKNYIQDLYNLLFQYSSELKDIKEVFGVDTKLIINFNGVS